MLKLFCPSVTQLWHSLDRASIYHLNVTMLDTVMPVPVDAV